MHSSISFTVVYCILAFVESASHRKGADMSPKLESFERMCAEQHNVSLTEVHERRGVESDIPVSEDMKCFDKCLLEKIGILNADGTIVDSVAIETFLVARTGDTEMINKAFKKCKPLSESRNTCPAIHKVLKCIIKELMSD